MELDGIAASLCSAVVQLNARASYAIASFKRESRCSKILTTILAVHLAWVLICGYVWGALTPRTYSLQYLDCSRMFDFEESCYCYLARMWLFHSEYGLNLRGWIVVLFLNLPLLLAHWCLHPVIYSFWWDKTRTYATNYLERQFGASQRVCNIGVDLVGPSKCLFRQDFVLQPIKIPSGHPHGVAMMHRNAANYAIDAFINRNGFVPFSISKSERDGNMRGVRCYHAPRDLVMTPQCDELGERDFIKIIDADYYYDMNEVLCLAKPTLIYTFVPEAAGGSDCDGVYTMADNMVKHVINGGGTYRHELWNYNHDVITAVKQYDGRFLRVVVFNVEQHRVADTQHRVVYFQPVKVFDGLVDELRDIPFNPLRRLKFSMGSVNYLAVHRDGQLHYSFSFANLPTSALMTATEFYTVLYRHKLSGKLNPGDIQRIVTKCDVNLATLLSALLADVNFDAGKFTKTIVNAAPPTGFAKHYTVVNEYLDTPKLYAREFAPCPLSNPAVFPSECHANDQACIDGRVNRVHNTTIPPSVYSQYAKEFQVCVVPETDLGVPDSLNEVMATMTEPNQVARLKKEYWFLDLAAKFTISAFQKREAYPEVKDPRNICKLNTNHLVHASAFTLPFKREILKKQSWFMPALTPPEIAARVAAFCKGRDFITEGDFSRFDGSISAWLRNNVERAMYLRYYPLCYHNQINKFFDDEITGVGYTKYGVKFKADGSRLSGSPFTTDGNSLINAFICFCALRTEGYSVEDAYEMLGLIYGDDSITAVDADIMVKVASTLGLKMKVKMVMRGQPCDFLGRVFIDPWTTTTTFQNLRRTLAKVHTTVAPAALVPLELAAGSKVEGYLASDLLTPVLGKWCVLMQALYPIAQAKITPEQSVALAKDRPFVSNTNGSWPQDSDDAQLMVEVVSKHLNIVSGDINAYESLLSKLYRDFVDGHGGRQLVLDALAKHGPVDAAESWTVVDIKRVVEVGEDLIDDTPCDLAMDFDALYSLWRSTEFPRASFDELDTGVVANINPARLPSNRGVLWDFDGVVGCDAVAAHRPRPTAEPKPVVAASTAVVPTVFTATSTPSQLAEPSSVLKSGCKLVPPRPSVCPTPMIKYTFNFSHGTEIMETKSVADNEAYIRHFYACMGIKHFSITPVIERGACINYGLPEYNPFLTAEQLTDLAYNAAKTAVAKQQQTQSGCSRWEPSQFIKQPVPICDSMFSRYYKA